MNYGVGYTEYCPHCEGQTEYKVTDIDSNGRIVCSECQEKILSCDLCTYYNQCGEPCEQIVVDAIQKAKADR